MSSIKKKVLDIFKRIDDFRNIKKDQNINKIFFKKYKTVKLISKSKFSSIYEGINIKTKEKIAIKLEEKNKYNLLEKEAYTLFSIKGYGIIDLLSFGKNTKYNIMIQPLLGDSIHNFFLSQFKNFSLSDICLISLQCLERIEWIHKNDIIHRDIKPDNFLFGIKDPRTIYLIDFGLSKKYRSKRTLKHIKYCYTRKIVGTARYTSINSLRGYEMSRRDDLESFYYMVIFFILKKLPWQDIKANSRVEKYHKILELKFIFDIDDYKILLPNEIIKMFKYVKKLKFEETPNYSMIKNSFKSILYNIGHTEIETFSWIKDRHILNSKVSPNITIRKSSLKKRILDKLDKYQIDKSSITSFSRKNMTESSLAHNIIDLDNFKSLQKSNYNVFTLSSNENNLKSNEYSTTPENKIYSVRKLNQTSKNKPIKLNKAVLKYIKIGNSMNMKTNKKIQLNTKYLPKKNIFKLSTIDPRINKNKSNINHNSYIKTENAQDDCSKYKINSNNINNLNLSQKYNLLNIRKNYSNINSNMNKNIIIPHNFLINNINSRNKVNKYLFIKKDGIMKPNDDKKFIINNTFINNFNNSNIININNKNKIKKNNLNLCVSLRNENIERKNTIVNKSNIKDTYFNYYINK